MHFELKRQMSNPHAAFGKKDKIAFLPGDQKVSGNIQGPAKMVAAHGQHASTSWNIGPICVQGRAAETKIRPHRRRLPSGPGAFVKCDKREDKK
jgi:hypothetical protein